MGETYIQCRCFYRFIISDISRHASAVPMIGIYYYITSDGRCPCRRALGGFLDCLKQNSRPAAYFRIYIIPYIDYFLMPSLFSSAFVRSRQAP